MGLYTQQDPIGIAGGLNLYGYANGDPINFSDPFGLCPPEDDNLNDCTPGSSEWYAARIARGEGNRLVNEVAGLFSTCGESIACNLVLAGGGVAGGAVGTLAAGEALMTSGGAAALTGRALASRTGQSLFGKGGSLNTGQIFRMGVSRAKDGGRFVFRASGKAIEKLFGRGKIDLVDLGKIKDFMKVLRGG